MRQQMIKMFVLIYKLFKNIKYMQNKKCSIALKRVLSILPEFTCVSPECHIERKYKVYRLYRYLIWRIWTIGYKTTIFLRYLPYFLNNSQSYSVLNGIMHWKLCSVERVKYVEGAVPGKSLKRRTILSEDEQNQRKRKYEENWLFYSNLSQHFLMNNLTK
jgi:hypothetical protein